MRVLTAPHPSPCPCVQRAGEMVRMNGKAISLGDYLLEGEEATTHFTHPRLRTHPSQSS